MTANQIRFRVRYAETDQMGIVHHAAYLTWIEMGRVELCRALGVRYRDMEEQDGILLTVAEARMRYMAPARFDDEVLVETTTRRASSRLLEFQYKVSNAESGQLLAEGSTTHVFCGRDLRPCRVPQRYYATFGIHGHNSLPASGAEPATY